MLQVLNEQPTHMLVKTWRQINIWNLQGNHFSDSASTGPLTEHPGAVIWGKNKPNLSLPSVSASAHLLLPDPQDQKDLRFYSPQQTPKPTKYLLVPNATFHTSLTWYFSSVSGDLHHPTRWRHHPSWTPHVFIARRNIKSSTLESFQLACLILACTFIFTVKQPC